jgi:Reverse transcriptase (RNA-dependent DNA polymerase)
VIDDKDLSTLKQAKSLQEWPEWNQGIQAKLNQLDQMGTWTLIDLPLNMKLIGNKWVFTKKRNKMGQLTKYKFRLIVKGCTQHPRYDYDKTYSPVVCMETICTILVITQAKNLLIQQMDIKGAYLNGTLKERVYIYQPKGFKDGTDHVCLLKKTLYGLRQSRHEWINKLDRKLHKHGYICLQSDPCAYV